MKLSTIPKRPTLASARAAKHMEQARECARMVMFYEGIADEATAEVWREVMTQKIADAQQITEDVWRYYK